MENQPLPPDLMRHQEHALLDVLSAEKLTVVRNLLEVMAESLSPIAGAGVGRRRRDHGRKGRGIESARCSLNRGEGISHDEILREFGLR